MQLMHPQMGMADGSARYAIHGGTGQIIIIATIADIGLHTDRQVYYDVGSRESKIQNM